MPRQIELEQPRGSTPAVPFDEVKSPDDESSPAAARGSAADHWRAAAAGAVRFADEPRERSASAGWRAAVGGARAGVLRQRSSDDDPAERGGDRTERREYFRAARSDRAISLALKTMYKRERRIFLVRAAGSTRGTYAARSVLCTRRRGPTPQHTRTRRVYTLALTQIS